MYNINISVGKKGCGNGRASVVLPVTGAWMVKKDDKE